MENKDLQSVLKKNSFTKLAGSEIYYLKTPVALNRTSNGFTIYAVVKDNKILFSDNGQLLDSFCVLSSEYEHVKTKIIKENIELNNLYVENNAIKMEVNELRFCWDVSRFIKEIIMLEDLIEKL